MFSAMLMMTVATAVSAQTTVKGRVTDKQGEPVPDFITFLRHYVAQNENQRVT